jgi:hypothetical protein
MKYFSFIKVILVFLLLIITDMTLASGYFDGTYSNVTDTVVGRVGITYTFQSNGKLRRHQEGLPEEREWRYDVDGHAIRVHTPQEIILILKEDSIVVPPGITLMKVSE